MFARAQQRLQGRAPLAPVAPRRRRLVAAAPTTRPTPSVVVVVVAAAGKGFGPKKAAAPSGGAKQQQQQQQKAATPDAASPCPCGSGLAYGACCQPAHTGRAPPDTPEKLLRSRFAGYRLGLVDYLVSTTHPRAPERRSAALGLATSGGAAAGDDDAGENAAAAEEERAAAYRASIARTARATDFVALAVDKAGADVWARSTGGDGGGSEQEAFLSFQVWYRSKGKSGGGSKTGGESVVRETSHFVRGADTQGRWLYLGEKQETAV
jgi:SEC-C motif-containing protein